MVFNILADRLYSGRLNLRIASYPVSILLLKPIPHDLRNIHTQALCVFVCL